MTAPFQYPAHPHVRRHGPQGYADYESYREWLRDEFAFACVFCLIREVWVPGGFHLDHFIPVALAPDRRTGYENLLYACSVCNRIKQDLLVPDPTVHLLANAVEVDATGFLISESDEATRIIERMRLNRPTYCRLRKMWISIVAMATKEDPELLKQILGYPVDLPNLSALRPPGGNTKSEGIEQSHWNRRQRGDLPEVY